jgi:predicted MFS family arabinose efflux permease
LSALALNFGVLTLLRFLAGLAMGGVFPLPNSVIAEPVPKNLRPW